MESVYLDSREEAARIAREALPFTTKHNLPANPLNYAVFYNYYAGHNIPLRDATAKLVDSGKPIEQSQLVELYQKYLSNNDEKFLMGIRKDLQKILTTAVDSVARIDGDSEQYQNHLIRLISGLTADDSAEGVKKVIDQITSETQLLVSNNRNMQSQLRSVTVELDALRMDFQRVQNDALKDPLTNISNRRSFDIQLSKLSKEANLDSPLCLMMIDIDHFKKINDTVGHLLGDQVLKSVARTLKDNIRGQDIVSRYGGEEFAILLPETSLSGGVLVANKICKKVASLVLKKRVNQELISNITVSIGLAQNIGNLKESDFISIADKNLYSAKDNGRNQVCS